MIKINTLFSNLEDLLIARYIVDEGILKFERLHQETSGVSKQDFETYMKLNSQRIELSEKIEDMKNEIIERLGV